MSFCSAVYLSLPFVRCDDAASRPKTTHVPKRAASTASKNSNPFDASDSNGKAGSYSLAAPEYAEPIHNRQPGRL